MPPFVLVPAVIELAFDPVARIGDWAVRLETIALALVFLMGLGIAVWIAGRTPIDLSLAPDRLDPDGGEENHLRRDDLLYVVVASIPGIVVGGRLGYALLHLDYYGADPGAILDLSQGSLQLSLAIVGGVLSGSLVGTLLGVPVGRWLHALAVPLLFVLAAGKAALVLGGDGQGVPVDLAWATAYLGPGPWGSLGPEIPSHPSQAYEAMATVLVMVVLGVLTGAGLFRHRDGRAFWLGIALWAGARATVAATWRDPIVLAGLRMDQVVSLAIAGVAVAAFVALTVRARRRPEPAPGGADAGSPSAPAANGLDWPDPANRPRF